MMMNKSMSKKGKKPLHKTITLGERVVLTSGDNIGETGIFIKQVVKMPPNQDLCAQIVFFNGQVCVVPFTHLGRYDDTYWIYCPACGMILMESTQMHLDAATLCEHCNSVFRIQSFGMDR
jgi:hypothetical protein